MATLARIHVYPFKSLDPQRVDEAVLLAGGALRHDRRFAIVDRQGEFVNGKRTPAIHRLRSRFDAAACRLALRVAGSTDEQTFDLETQRGRLAEWLSDYFDMPVSIVENADGGFPDDGESPGPTVISRATLAEVATWFPGLSADDVRDRIRANLEIDGVEPFWEDRLVAESLDAVRFRVGEAELLGTGACQRCVVPSRNPRSGEAIAGFARQFAQQRQASLPAWAPRGRFDHFYRLAVTTRRMGGRECTVRVGDEVSIVERG